MPAIPESEYVRDGDVVAVTDSQILRYHGNAGYTDFCNWFGVGTSPHLSDGRCGIYLSDYLGWLAGGVNDD